MYQLLETIKFIGVEAQNLSLHEERLNRSRFNLFGSNDLLKLSDYISVPDDASDKIIRCRIIYSTAIVSIDFSQYTPANIKTLKIVSDDTLNYDYKYLDRKKLTALIDKREADDILIVKNSCITDASFANVVFTDGQRWITPDTPLLRGTMRELLLRNGVIKEDKITVSDLAHFTHFRLINAMLGFDAPLLPISNIIQKSNLI